MPAKEHNLEQVEHARQELPGADIRLRGGIAPSRLATFSRQKISAQTQQLIGRVPGRRFTRGAGCALQQATPEQNVQTAMAHRARRTSVNVQPSSLAALAPADIDHALRHRFEAVATALPSHTAILDAHGALSYAELLDLAGRFAHAISERLPLGEPVALCLKTDRHVVAAMLGALFAGRPYVPLDPAYPADHLKRVMTHSGAKLVITSASDPIAPHADIQSQEIAALTSAEILDTPASKARATFDGAPAPESPAYIIYTSGSTGAPKGVWQDQRGLLHDILQYSQVVRPTSTDRHSLLYSPCVNGALRDIYGTLLNGATLCMSNLRGEGLRKVLHDLAARRVTLLHAMPPVLRSLVRVADGPICPDARLFYTAGDRFLTQDLLAARANLPKTCDIYTGIGSTECATIYRHWIVPQDFMPDTELVPVGYALADREMRLVDDHGRDVPVGSVGQIRVESRYIARGYWNDVELTRRSFLADPLRPEWRIFQPGDLGRERPDGLLDFLGRADRQIKIRGYRIEPAETEAALRRIEGVAEAAILPAEHEDRTSLVAFVEPADGAILTEETIKQALHRSLPSQSQPERVIVLAHLPRLGNFKLDVKALRAQLDETAPAAVPLAGLPEAYLALWTKVLRRTVDPDATLEAIGADSLELLELDLLLERDFRLSLRGALRRDATPRTIWRTAAPAIQRHLTRHAALDEKLHALATLMASSDGIPMDPDGLVRLYNHRGTRTPIIWCFNQVLEANCLAPILGEDQPLLAMRSLAGLYKGLHPSPTDVRQVTGRYIEIVLARDLAQRVVVGGNCQAVPFSFQVANALALAGHKVASLVLMERMLPVPYGGRMLVLFGRDSRKHNPAHQFANPMAGWGQYLRNGHSAIIEGEHGRFFLPENIGSLASTLRAEVDQSSAGPGLPELARRAGLSVTIVSAEERTVSVRIENPNEIAFEVGDISHIAVTIHALAADEVETDDRPLRIPDLTIPLPRRLPGGEAINVTISLPPDTGGSGAFRLDLCEEGVAWFTLTENSRTVIRM